MNAKLGFLWQFSLLHAVCPLSWLIIIIVPNTFIKSFLGSGTLPKLFTHIILTRSSKQPLLSFFCREGDGGGKNLNNMPKVTQLLMLGLNSAKLTPEPNFLNTYVMLLNQNFVEFWYLEYRPTSKLLSLSNMPLCSHFGICPWVMGGEAQPVHPLFQVGPVNDSAGGNLTVTPFVSWRPSTNQGPRPFPDPNLISPGVDSIFSYLCSH